MGQEISSVRLWGFSIISGIWIFASLQSKFPVLYYRNMIKRGFKYLEGI